MKPLTLKTLLEELEKSGPNKKAADKADRIGDKRKLYKMATTSFDRMRLYRDAKDIRAER